MSPGLGRSVDRRSLLEWLRPHVFVFDRPLLTGLMMVVLISLAAQYSAAFDFPGRFDGHVRNLVVAGAALWVAAMIPPALLMRIALPLYGVGVALLVAVALFGVTNKGAQRWLDIGITRIQPSEVLKIATPLMLAWYFQQREGTLRWTDFLIAALILMVPVGLIAKQPDLGTAILVLAAGGYVIFFAGLAWRVIVGLIVAGLGALPLLWMVMHEYQRQRVLTLIDPTSDPLGKGFHIIQSMIAVGSGGVFGKGWGEGTQSRLDFLPEHTTDFIFSVFAEEFGLVGVVGMLLLFTFIIGRSLWIVAQSRDTFARLVGSALAMTFFLFVVLNSGMISGVLPVVGVPMPLMSYGGTSAVSLLAGFGIILSVNAHRRFMGE